MRYFAILILFIFGVGCTDSNTSSTQTTEVKMNALKNPEKMDTIKNLSAMLNKVLITQKLFIGKHKVTYYDGSFKNIEIDSMGNIKGSANYKLFRVLNHEHNNAIYLIKGNDESTSPKDTFSYTQQGSNIKFYLINNHQNKYKFTLTKIIK